MNAVTRVCHYCPAPGDTKDHVVPRSRLRQVRMPLRFYGWNQVPCCYDCNQRKGDRRSTCECERCAWLWGQYERRSPRPDPLVGWRRTPDGWTRVLEAA